MTSNLLNLITPVCEPCNRRMNRWIENPVQLFARRLIFEREPRELSRKEQRVLAHWGLKVMMFMNISRVPEPLRAWLAKDGRPAPPAQSAVWVGQYAEDAPSASPTEQLSLQPTRFSSFMTWCQGFHVARLVMVAAYAPAFAQLPATHPAERLGYLVTLPRVPPRRQFLAWPPLRPLNQPMFDATRRFFRSA